jgi:DNA-binding NarL/FixJ family response regulator
VDAKGQALGAPSVDVHSPTPERGAAPVVKDSPPSGHASLVPSELGIARLVAQGLTNKEIGARLFMSPHTVDSKLRRIFRKLAIATRVELARAVVEHELVLETS